MLRTSPLAVLSCLLLVSFAGCAKRAAAPAGGGGAAVPASTKGETSSPVSEEEARQFADKFVQAIMQNDQAAISALFDWNALADRSIEGLSMPPQMLSGIKTGMLNQLQQNNTLVGQVTQAIAQGGSYKLVNVHEVDGKWRVLLRLMIPEGGINYHDIVLAKGTDGSVRGIDMHIFLSGELLSTTMKRIMLAMTASQNRSLVERLTGQDQLIVKHDKEVLQIINSIRSGNLAEGLRVYHTLPSELQQDKSLLLLRLRASQSAADDREYQQCLTDFRKHHPNDTCIDFLSIDYFITREEYPEALAAIDSVDRSVGGDPYLSFLKGNVYFQAKQMEEAEQAFSRMTSAEPDYVDGWWSLVSVNLEQQDFMRVLELLKTIDEKFTMQWADLTQQAEYAGFTASPQHQEWLDFLAQKPKPGE